MNLVNEKFIIHPLYIYKPFSCAQICFLLKKYFNTFLTTTLSDIRYINIAVFTDWILERK